MAAVQHYSRIDTFELKLQIERSLGSQKAQKHFHLLTNYLSRKLTKSEFNKLCVGVVGRENVRLHNELIRVIVKNATVSNTLPSKQVKIDGHLPLEANGIYSVSGLQSVFPQSPKKRRTPNLRERKFKDRPSPLGLQEKSHTIEDLEMKKVQEQQSATKLFSIGSKPPIEVNSIKDDEEVMQDAISPRIYSRGPIRALFGVNIQSKKTQKIVSNGSVFASHTDTCHYNGQLLPMSFLANRLKQKLKMEGLDISIDCVDLLNNGLDSFLKKVINPSLELASSRSVRKQDNSFSLSMLDLCVVTERNPNILGEYCLIQLEKIRFSELEWSAQ